MLFELDRKKVVDNGRSLWDNLSTTCWRPGCSPVPFAGVATAKEGWDLEPPDISAECGREGEAR